MSNAHLFPAVAREYANFRPGYPPELFELARARRAGARGGLGLWLRQRPGQHRAGGAFCRACTPPTWPPEQIAAARPHPRVAYAVAPAERSGLADA